MSTYQQTIEIQYVDVVHGVFQSYQSNHCHNLVHKREFHTRIRRNQYLISINKDKMKILHTRGYFILKNDLMFSYRLESTQVNGLIIEIPGNSL